MHSTRLVRNLFARFVALAFTTAFTSSAAAQPALLGKLDPVGTARATLSSGRSRVIISALDATSLSFLTPIVQWSGGQLKRTLPLVNGVAVDLPNAALSALAASPLVSHIAIDRLVVGSMERTGATVGATAVRQELGYDGSGVGVAVIDSGAAASLDDLSDGSGGSRVDQFVDFVNGRQDAYDDYGHGTHVAGIIAGNGFDSSGRRTGIAPGARLVVLKVLDDSGQGRISDVIAAIDYAIAQKDTFNIRVINLSVATGVYESYNVDPLTLAAQRAVNAGIVVVAAAGNNGRSPAGTTQYAGITAPGNAPWVLTVGASSHMGTVDRSDDTIAPFSSRGPGAIDFVAKPDVVAPGVGIESLSNPDSAFYLTKSAYLLSGTVPTSYLPYLSLSGTSMSAPVVAGTVALMLQANPHLTPNAIKGIIEYTAQPYAGYDRLTQGAGFLNAKGAVELSQYFATRDGDADENPQGDDDGNDDDCDYPSSPDWSMQIIWGNRLIQGGELNVDKNAWRTSTIWGASTTANNHPIIWGGDLSDTGQNVVWGSLCNGDDCATNWTIAGSGVGVVMGADDGDTVVWGTSDDGDTVVWGTSCSDPSCTPVVWNTP
jgi:serine protease AprX